MNILDLCKKGIKRKQIQDLIKFLKDNKYESMIDDYYGESVYPGKNGIEEYLSRLDGLRHRIGVDLGNKDKKLPQANSKRHTKVGKDKYRYNFLMYNKNSKNIAYIGYTDNKEYSGGKVEDDEINYFYDGALYRSTITYDQAKKEMIYNLACNEFISQQNEKVASFVVLMKNFTDNNFTQDTLYEFFKSCSCYDNGEANIPKLYKMILAQRDLGIPYLPILGGDGKVLCVKLSKLLSMMKNDEFYKSPKTKVDVKITDEEIKSLQEFEAKKIPELATELKNHIEKKIPQSENKYASGQHNASNEVSNKEHGNDVSETQQQKQSENKRAINKVLQREVENIDKPTPSNQESQWWNPLTWNCNCCNNASQINSEEQAEKELIHTN